MRNWGLSRSKQPHDGQSEQQDRSGNHFGIFEHRSLSNETSRKAVGENQPSGSLCGAYSTRPANVIQFGDDEGTPIVHRGGRFPESQPAGSSSFRASDLIPSRSRPDIPRVNSRQSLSAERLREVLDYNPDSGQFTRKAGKPHLVGKPAGNVHHSGYCRIRVDNHHYLAHRLAWLYVHGEWPKDIDHINRDKLDNRVCNLREATHSQNLVNRAARARSGFEGVYRDARCTDRPWIAQLSYRGKKKHLGNFSSVEDAAKAFHRASIEIHGEFAETAR